MRWVTTQCKRGVRDLPRTAWPLGLVSDQVPLFWGVVSLAVCPGGGCALAPVGGAA